MRELMRQFRTQPPQTLGGIALRQLRDYLALAMTTVDANPQRTPMAEGAEAADMVILDLAEAGYYVAIRPSGTEPKVKFYLFTFVAAEQLHLLDVARQEMDGRLSAIEADLRALAEGIGSR